MMLILISFWGLSTYQRDAFRKAYGLSEQVDLFNSNSTQVFNRLTRSSQEEIRRQIKENPDQFENLDFLENLNQELKKGKAPDWAEDLTFDDGSSDPADDRVCPGQLDL